jgi:ketosteroid isomerase-like protein
MFAGWVSIFAGFSRFHRTSKLGFVRGPTDSIFSEYFLGGSAMKAKNALYGAVLVVLSVVGSARAEDLRAVMEADNARWLAAYNTNTPEAFPAMYTKDAVVLPPGSQPVNVRQAIGQFWEDRLKPGNRKDHTFEIISLQQDGQYAYQVARWTLNIFVKTGEPMKVSGNTVRIFEHQPDGAWLTKVHIFTVNQ